MAKRTDYRGYKKKFERIMSDGTPILNDDKKRLQIAPDEKFVQCYVPNHPVRKDYPKYVFVSNKGNFVSVYRNEPRWLTPSYTSNGRESYKLSVKGNAKSTIGYIVVAVCHDAMIYGKAARIMEEKGRKAFKKPKKNDPFRGEMLNVHHTKGYDLSEGRAYNNNPKTLLILTINVHDLFERVPAEDAPYDEQFKFMMELANTLTEEEPNKISMFMPGTEKKTGDIFVIENTSKIQAEILKELSIRKNNRIQISFAPMTNDPECVNDMLSHMKEMTNAATVFFKELGDKFFLNDGETSSGKKYQYMIFVN